MKKDTLQELKKTIAGKMERLKGDDALQEKSADIVTNAPLALIQLELESRIAALRWVIAEIEKLQGYHD